MTKRPPTRLVVLLAVLACLAALWIVAVGRFYRVESYEPDPASDLYIPRPPTPGADKLRNM